MYIRETKMAKQVIFKNRDLNGTKKSPCFTLSKLALSVSVAISIFYPAHAEKLYGASKNSVSGYLYITDSYTGSNTPALTDFVKTNNNTYVSLNITYSGQKDSEFTVLGGKWDEIYGGYFKNDGSFSTVNPNVKNNVVYYNNFAFNESSSFFGGYTENGAITDNHFIIDNANIAKSTVSAASGSYTAVINESEKISGNRLIINDGTIKNSKLAAVNLNNSGADADFINVSGNILEILTGTFINSDSDHVYWNRIYAVNVESGNANISNNELNIYGGYFRLNTQFRLVETQTGFTGTVDNNSLSICGNADINEASLIGYKDTDVSHSGNTLYFGNYTKDGKLVSWNSSFADGNVLNVIKNFDNIEFRSLEWNRPVTVSYNLVLNDTTVKTSDVMQISGLSETDLLSHIATPVPSHVIFKASDSATIYKSDATVDGQENYFILKNQGPQKLYGKGKLTGTADFKSISYNINPNEIYSGVRTLNSSLNTYDFSKVGFEGKSEVGHKTGTELRFENWEHGDNNIKSIEGFDKITLVSGNYLNNHIKVTKLDLSGTTLNAGHEFFKNLQISENSALNGENLSLIQSESDVITNISTRIGDIKNLFTLSDGQRKIYGYGSLNLQDNHKNIGFKIDNNSLYSQLRILTGNYDLSNIGFENSIYKNELQGNDFSLTFSNWNSDSNKIKSIEGFTDLRFDAGDYLLKPVTVTGTLDVRGTNIKVSSTYKLPANATENDVLDSRVFALIKSDNKIIADNKTAYDKTFRPFELNHGERQLYGFAAISLSDNGKEIGVAALQDQIYSKLRTLNGNADFSKIKFEAVSDIGNAAGTTLTFNGWTDHKNNEIAGIEGFDYLRFTSSDYLLNPVYVTGTADLRGTTVSTKSFTIPAYVSDEYILNGNSIPFLVSKNGFLTDSKTTLSNNGIFSMPEGKLKLYGEAYIRFDNKDNFHAISYAANPDAIYSQLRTLSGFMDLSKVGFEANSELGAAAGKTLKFDDWYNPSYSKGYPDFDNSIRSIEGFDKIIFTSVDFDDYIHVKQKLDLSGTTIEAGDIYFNIGTEDLDPYTFNGYTYLIKADDEFNCSDIYKSTGIGRFEIGTGFEGIGIWVPVKDGIQYIAIDLNDDPEPDNITPIVIPVITEENNEKDKSKKIYYIVYDQLTGKARIHDTGIDNKPLPLNAKILSPVITGVSNLAAVYRNGSSFLNTKDQTHSVLMAAKAPSIALKTSAENYEKALDSVMSNSDGSGFNALLNMGGSSVSEKTGSSVKAKLYSLALGTGYKIITDKVKAVLALGFEYTKGNFKNRSDAGNTDEKINKKGNVKAFAMNLSANAALDNGVHVNTSLRFGRTITKLNSALYGNDTFYDVHMNSPFFSVKFGGGYEFNLSADTSVDLFSNYTFTHINSSSFDADGSYKVDALNSAELEAGTKLTMKFNLRFKGYSAIRYSYEFDNQSKGSFKALEQEVNLRPCKGKGGTGKLDIGGIYYPTDNENLYIDLSLSGMTGKMKGVSGTISGKYLF